MDTKKKEFEEVASELISTAETWEKTVEAWEPSTDKSLWLDRAQARRDAAALLRAQL